MRSRSYALVPDEAGTSLLLLRGADGWEIPHRETTDRRGWHFVANVNHGFGDLLSLDVTTLRCLAETRVDDGFQLRFYELETHGSTRRPSRAAWLDRDDLETAPLAEPEHRPLLLRCLDDRDDDGGPLAVAWARPGWFDGAVSWVRARLAELRVEPSVVVQERTWSISTVLRAATPEGDFYFKAVPPVFAAEPALTRALALHHPGRVPDIAALDEERAWMLMPDFGGEALRGRNEPSILAAALRAYAELQRSWIPRTDELAVLGCADRTLAKLDERLELLGETELLLPGRPQGLADDELAAVPALAERLRHASERLRAYELPPTLDHGDLHTDNVRLRDGAFLVLDWSDACISVPFFSLVPFLAFHPEPLSVELRELLRDAYLEGWAEVAGAPRLVEAFELAHFVGLFHQAVSYQRITEGTEPRARWEWERGFPFFVKRLLRSEQ